MIEQTLTDPQRNPKENADRYDLIIIGAGPAGLSAALCAARAQLKILLIEKALPGGQCSTACQIDNYIGFPGGILGDQLALRMEEQLDAYGIAYTCENVSDILEARGKEKVIKTDLGNVYRAAAIILAIGLEPKALGAGFEKKFMGRGISYYARCDVDYYQDEDVMVIGGGNCACYAADYLSKFVKKVYMVHHFDRLRAVKSLKESISKNPKIDLMWNSRVTEVFGIEKVEKAKVTNVITQQHTWLNVKGIFVYVGRIPPKIALNMELNLDEDGFIITDEYMRTNVEGIYAVGDIRSKQVRQIATAVSDGMIAAINVERDLFR